MIRHDTSTASWIQETNGVCGGEACIRNTRHTVRGLVQWRKLGLSDDQILQQHPDLTQPDLDVVGVYYSEHQAEIDQAIRADEDA
jgi:uncharacterized protein (DUF433 family)